ncbi:hypothetical protein DRQ36_10525, partial [bacterium]
PLPAPDTLVTIMTDGFRWGGPLMWRRIVDGGWLGTTYWTNSMIHGPDVSTGTWVPVLPADGEYDVYAYIPEEHSVANCVYKIGHTSGLAEVVIDQSLFGDEWVYLGCWDFTAADSPFVYLGDSTGTSGENIAVDAVVWRTHIVGVAERKLPEKPEISVYPNPFNSSVNIRVQGFEGSRVQMRIYDINGRNVANIPVREGLVPSRETGDHKGRPYETVWTPDESIPSGVYLVRVDVGGITATKHVAYLK